MSFSLRHPYLTAFVAIIASGMAASVAVQLVTKVRK